ncbi:MAG: hypothetical protein N838_03535 [Thiohalocapsa sp. PB-PSB1]|nr:MAG: hypothetical protein N838_03535 [Thiohalocapsa sp. PB-PSB1]
MEPYAGSPRELRPGVELALASALGSDPHAQRDGDGERTVTEIVFYEKPGCIGNARQKRILTRLGHQLEVHDLLSEPWSREQLRAFFCELEVKDWFNPSAPRIKSGHVDPSKLDERSALELLLAEPLLIRRPLIESVHGRCCGFEPNPVLNALGVQFDEGDDLQSCPRDQANEPACDTQSAASPASQSYWQ